MKLKLVFVANLLLCACTNKPAAQEVTQSPPPRGVNAPASSCSEDVTQKAKIFFDDHGRLGHIVVVEGVQSGGTCAAFMSGIYETVEAATENAMTQCQTSGTSGCMLASLDGVMK